jgi:hypothetical protein
LSLSLALPSRAAKFVQFFSLSPSTFECNPKTGGGAKTSAASRQGRGGKTVAASVLVTQSISICRADRERGKRPCNRKLPVSSNLQKEQS